jgi:hypothetical protein
VVVEQFGSAEVALLWLQRVLDPPDPPAASRAEGAAARGIAVGDWPAALSALAALAPQVRALAAAPHR